MLQLYGLDSKLLARVALALASFLFAAKSFAGEHQQPVLGIAQVPEQAALLTELEVDKFKQQALRNGLSLENIDARFYFVGNNSGIKCFGGNNIIGCHVSGPGKILLAFKGEFSMFDISIRESVVCYTGVEGRFCSQE